MPSAPRSRLPSRLHAAAAVAFVALAVHAAHTGLGLGGRGSVGLFDEWLYNALMLGGAGAIALHAMRTRTDRPPWALLAVGALSWSAGDLLYSIFLAGDPSPPFPSISDALFLVWYPASFAALALLVRAHVREFPLSLGVDAVTGGLTVSALAAAVLYDAVRVTVSGNTLSILATLAYPVGDVLLVAFVVGLFALTGWRPGRTWALIGLALVLSSAGDAAYLVMTARGVYAEGTLLDSVWPATLLLLALAGLSRPRFNEPRLESLRVLLVPSACGLAAMGLLILAQFATINPLALALACATIGSLLVRMAVTLRENLRMVAASRGEALTDLLTGLGNRRRLVADLEGEIAAARAGEPRVLLLFDLDGFKRYNDSFGHLAGDALLARLGAKLQSAVAPAGRAYRLGGDEFCAVVRAAGDFEGLLAGAAGALSETGEGFTVASSYGAVLLPHEAADPISALQVADQRMYTRKERRSSPAREQTRDVLVRALHARQPDLHRDASTAAELAVAVARRLGIDGEAVDEVARAAELHDVGNVAVPDAILDKRGALDEDEWSFMRRHTILGERILNGAPAMRPVARLVRSTHERFDGEGYPDGLSGEEIPLGARIVSVCGAYDAMVTGRPYRHPVDQPRAVRELAGAAGTQFDPAVVEAFLAELRARSGGGAAAPADANQAAAREVATQIRETLHSP